MIFKVKKLKRVKSKAHLLLMQGRAGPMTSKSNNGKGEKRRENGVVVIEVESIDLVQMQRIMKGLGEVISVTG